MYEQNASYLLQHSELGSKNFNKIWLKFVQKVLKWPLQYVNFQKFSGGACLRTPLQPFFILNMLENNSAEKLPLKYMSNLGSPP